MKYIILLIFIIVSLFSIDSVSATVDCAPFYDSLNNLSSVYANGGIVTGSLTFVPGVNGNAANFDGASHITYNNTIFNSESGSVSLWFRKNSTSGGIMQIGEIGQRNSLGIFYIDYQDKVYFEIRNDNNNLMQASGPNATSYSEFNHIIAMWDKRGDAYHFKLFVNGRYAGGNALTGPFIHNQSSMELGRTGYYGNGKGSIDELRFFDHALSDPEVYAEYVYSSNKYRYQETNKPVSTGDVKIINKSLFVNNEPFKVKGVGYQPIPIGKSVEYGDGINDTFNFLYQRDFPLLRNMHVNTIRTWARVTNVSFLDAAYNNDVRPIYVVMGYWISPYQDFSNATVRAGILNDFGDYVATYKDHSAVLMWALGNENNLFYQGNVSDWYSLANDMAEVAYNIEGSSYHPTIIVNGYMLFFGEIDYGSDDISMNYVDVWGHNSYTGYEFNCYFDYYDAISAKPLVLTEFGIDAFNFSSGGEYQEVQAEWVVHQWQQIANSSAGGTLMEYSDEWWKAAGSPYFHGIGGYPTDTQPDGYANEEWWGVMAIQDNGSSPDIMIPRQVYYALASEFEEPNEPPVLDPIGDRIVNETETLIIDVDASDPDNDTLLYGTSAIFGTFDPVTGLFTWTPTYDDSGVYYVTFNVTDGLEWDNETITITVNNVNRPPVLDTIDDRIVYENETLIIQLNATDPDNDTLVYGTNATFGSFNPNIGLFEWTPTFDDSDVYSVLFNVTDGQLWDSEIITITVINVNRVPVLESIGNKEVDEGQLLQFTVSATDPDNDNLTYSANNLPTGASFNPDAQEFIWTPTYDQTGVYSDVQFVVSDGDLTDYENITITVNNVNRAPILNPIGDRIIDEGETLVIDVNAIDPDDDTLTYYTNATFGTFNTTTGLFEWVPDFDDAGVYSVMFNVTDGEFWDEETIAITVNNAGLIDLWMTNFTGPLIHPGAIPLAFATVKNIGPDDSGPFEVGFYKLRGRIRYNRTDWWNWDISFISSEEVTNLTPNESIEVPFGGYCRTCTILAIADHTQIINETNEYNNVKRYPELTPYVIRPY